MNELIIKWIDLIQDKNILMIRTSLNKTFYVNPDTMLLHDTYNFSKSMLIESPLKDKIISALDAYVKNESKIKPYIDINYLKLICNL
jgi:hypothetical protein